MAWVLATTPLTHGLLLLMLLGGGLMPHAAHAQSTEEERADTEERLNALRSQINRDQERLRSTEREASATRERLDELNREIALRQELVDTYERRLRQLQQQQREARDTLQTLDSARATLVDEYKSRANHAYRYGRLHDLALILSSKSINQMIVRVRYLHQFAAQRRSRRNAIQEAQATIEAQQEELAASQRETQQLLTDARSERNRLQGLRRDRRQVVDELRAEQSALREEIERKQESVEELQQRIEDLIAAADEEAEGTGTRAGGLSDADYERLSSSFAENQGQLPWPAEGAITEGYGDQVDPVHGTTTNNPGITIATNPRDPVRSVFDGSVSGIDFVPGFGTYLVIRHGDFLSVYSNLSDLDVSMGESVSAGDRVGWAGTENEPRGAGVFFAIFDADSNASNDPTRWLRAR
ncbi:MAG: peptidoglycan DD-metalloendopeptidase family protein [Longimonas sp.]|uniref:murein hydrolase activator EnvC family protein n=1 Tax=Longimonas sp. TaxID=2039626 RepID=UPI003974D3E9